MDARVDGLPEVAIRARRMPPRKERVREGPIARGELCSTRYCGIMRLSAFCAPLDARTTEHRARIPSRRGQLLSMTANEASDNERARKERPAQGTFLSTLFRSRYL